MKDIILYGNFYLPPSVNEMYKTIFIKGTPRRAKTAKALQYEQELLWHLTSQVYPQFIAWNDPLLIRLVKEAAAKNSRTKTELKPAYLLEVLCEFDKDSSDVDGRHKALQDVLSTWLGINDNRIYKIIEEKVLGSNPHVEFVFSKLDMKPVSGSLLARTIQQPITPEFYRDDTEKVESHA